MDPDCAICNAPATMACDCEAKGLEVAVKQAEDRMMRSIYSDTRAWARGHAQDYILEYFSQLTEHRKAAHNAHVDRITAHAWHYFNTQPHPTQIADANAALKRGIDEDWQSSVQRYPEVLEYFFSLVDVVLPADDEDSVRAPPLSGTTNYRKAHRRGSNGAGAGAGSAAIAPAGFERGSLPPQEIPPMHRMDPRMMDPRMMDPRNDSRLDPRDPRNDSRLDPRDPRADRRTPGPAGRRAFGHPPPHPQPAASYYPPYQ